MSLTNRSKPIPVSTCFAGNGSRLPSFNRLNCINTLFQISITCGWSLFTSSFASCCLRSLSVRQSTCISVQGPQGPVSPISQKLSFLPNGNILSSAVSYTHLRAHETPEHLVCRLL